jgi:polysaccharide chain length determinant protein (PEP-CTERM system associated)
VINRNVNRQNVLTNKNDLALQDYIDIFWRRKWWFILPSIVGTLITILVSYSLPPIYRSSTLILVEPQKVPQSYVSPTVTSPVEDRLNTISQQILSRTNLEKIIKEFGLYAKDDAALSGSSEGLKEKLKQLLVSFKLYAPPGGAKWGPERYVEGMREAIEIKVMGGSRKNSFIVAYTGREPKTVMQVTNALASLFIEENLKVRERQAEGTSEFLANELAVAERELRVLEGGLKEFKERHRGALPEQLDANLRTLDRLQLELQNIGEALRSTEERRVFYEQQLKGTKANQTSGVIAQSPSNPLEAELQALKSELARLQAQFHDQYPDVVVLKKRIYEAERRLAREDVLEAPVVLSTTKNPGKFSPLYIQLRTLETEINSLKQRRNQILNVSKQYEKRIEQTYDNELKILTINRDYNTSKSNYEALLAKRLNAKLSYNLEKRQKGEQFKVLDPANMPRKPFRPNRVKIILIGNFVSAAIGVALILLLEYLNPYFHRPEDFDGTLEYPVLVTIPSNVGLKNGYDQLVSVDNPDSVITEQYRILYAKLHESQKEKSQKVFAISSSLQGEGKTLTALNLAVVIARDFGKRTLLLEGDFKAPAISRYLKAELESGLVDLLLGKDDIQSTLIPFADTLIPFADDNLSLLPAVKSVRNSSGLLSSQRMRDLLETLREQYDFILIDAPPILPLSDMQIFEEVVDGILMVVRAEKTPKDALVKAVHALQTDKIVGIVLNDSPQPLPEAYRYVAV